MNIIGPNDSIGDIAVPTCSPGAKIKAAASMKHEEKIKNAPVKPTRKCCLFNE